MIKFESEKHLENFIVDCFNDDSLCIVNDEEYQSLSQHFDTGGYGIPDLVFYSKETEQVRDDFYVDHMRLHVVELKNEPIKLSHISQIARYKRYFDRALYDLGVEMTFSLVVPESVSSNDDVVWLIDSLDGIDVVEFSLNPKSGIKFEKSSGWHKTKENKQKALSLFEDCNEE